MIATATCPKCSSTNELLACQNCGGTDFRRGALNDGSEGMICKACNLGFSHISCQSGCGTIIPATAFGTPVSRAAGRMQQGMTAEERLRALLNLPIVMSAPRRAAISGLGEQFHSRGIGKRARRQRSKHQYQLRY
jgi:hypothetical protein